MEINYENIVVCIVILLIGALIGVVLEDRNLDGKYKDNFVRGLDEGRNRIPLDFNADDNTLKTAGYINGYLYGFPYIGNNYTGIQNHTLLIKFDK